MRRSQKLFLTLIATSAFIGAVMLASRKKGTEAATPEAALQRGLAPTPPMGWNSYDCYGGDVTEKDVKANADFMAGHLAQYGWQYIVVDYFWYFPSPATEPHTQEGQEVAMDDFGRLLPDPNRFPSAADGRGFKPLADYVHSKGLKFGIHIMRGIPRVAVKKNLPILGTSARAQEVADFKNSCSWSTAMHGVDVRKPAGQAYYDSIVALYAEWGVDYIKADDMSWATGTNPAGVTYQALEIEALRKAINKSGRPIVLSLSPGPTDPAHADHAKKHAELWRISGDFWDEWKLLKKQFEMVRPWVSYVGPNHWPDADMIPLGRLRLRGFDSGHGLSQDLRQRTRLTPDEARTFMTLWMIFRSPLMFGGDLPRIDPFTLSFLTNEEALAVNQASTGNRELFARGDHIAWVADVPKSRDKYLALFNLSDDEPAAVVTRWRELGLTGKCVVRDLWERKDLGGFETQFAPTVAPHGAGLYRVKPER
jgi:alpha-galactosidase